MTATEKKAEQHRQWCQRPGNKEKLRAYRAKWRAKHPERYKQLYRESYTRCREARRRSEQVYYRKIMDDPQRHAKHTRLMLAINKRTRARRWNTDPAYRLAWNIRARIATLLRKASAIRVGTVPSLVGCTWRELSAHIEKLFSPGMSWDNYGRSGWHMDHIIPIDSFDLTDPEQQRRCFHFSNLQPLWALDNIRKGNRIP